MKKTKYAILATAIATAFSLPCSQAKEDQASLPITEASVRDGLVLHLACDRNEADGKVEDSSGRGNHGKATGVRWTPDGRKGGAYEFTADGNRIEVPNQESLNPKQMTLAAWVKTSAADDQWRRVFDKSYSQGYALSIAADWEGNKWKGLASMEIGPGTHFTLTRSMVADGNWHHLAATFNGIEQLLYVDGKPEGQALLWDNAGRVGGNAFSLLIGCSRHEPPKDGFTESFRGIIDEPMMWNRALSPKEIAFVCGAPAAAQDKEEASEKMAASRKPSAIDPKGPLNGLAGVVHLSDDDIRFCDASGVTVFVDPVSWPSDKLVAQSGMVKPDLILITHPHGDHFQPTLIREYLSLNPKAIIAGPSDVVKMARQVGLDQVQLVTPGQNYTLAGIRFSTVSACFLEGDSHPKANQWVGYVLQLNGSSYYVTGDTQPLPSMAKTQSGCPFSAALRLRRQLGAGRQNGGTVQGPRGCARSHRRPGGSD